MIAQDGSFADDEHLFPQLARGGRIRQVVPLVRPQQKQRHVFYVFAGFIQHRIRFEVKNNNVQALRDDYAEGYDRYSGGFAMKQEIGYMQVSNNRRINFYVAVEFFAVGAPKVTAALTTTPKAPTPKPGSTACLA